MNRRIIVYGGKYPDLIIKLFLRDFRNRLMISRKRYSYKYLKIDFDRSIFYYSDIVIDEEFKSFKEIVKYYIKLHE